MGKDHKKEERGDDNSKNDTKKDETKKEERDDTDSKKDDSKDDSKKDDKNGSGNGSKKDGNVEYRSIQTHTGSKIDVRASYVHGMQGDIGPDPAVPLQEPINPPLKTRSVSVNTNQPAGGNHNDIRNRRNPQYDTLGIIPGHASEIIGYTPDDDLIVVRGYEAPPTFKAMAELTRRLGHEDGIEVFRQMYMRGDFHGIEGPDTATKAHIFPGLGGLI